MVSQLAGSRARHPSPSTAIAGSGRDGPGLGSSGVGKPREGRWASRPLSCTLGLRLMRPEEPAVVGGRRGPFCTQSASQGPARPPGKRSLFQEDNRWRLVVRRMRARLSTSSTSARDGRARGDGSSTSGGEYGCRQAGAQHVEFPGDLIPGSPGGGGTPRLWRGGGSRSCLFACPQGGGCRSDRSTLPRWRCPKSARER